MDFTGPLIAFGFIVLVVVLLLKKYNAHAVLLFSGLSMMLISWNIGYDIDLLLGLDSLQNKTKVGFKSTSGLNNSFDNILDFFKYLVFLFQIKHAKVCILIMTIGGFVAYINKIGASYSLVNLVSRPLQIFKKYPDIAAVLVIPIGQLLFICIPSAAGLGLLLMASIFPILINLGVSRLSAVSVITACTALGMGPASAMSNKAAEFAFGSSDQIIVYFSHQIQLALPITLVFIIVYYFTNKYFDKKDNNIKDETIYSNINVIAPKIYSIIPILPLFLLIIFSKIMNSTIILDTSTAMFLSLFIAIAFEFLFKRNFKEVFASLNTFWSGMGNIFKSVVTLIIVADVFASGLLSLNFINALINISENLGFVALGIGIVMVILIFLSAMIMGSGNAAFFSFGPLAPEIAQRFNVNALDFILPMNLAASMGRTVSPVSGVLIATSEIAKVSSVDIVKRNIIPLIIGLFVMILYHFI
jgi:DcuC family C4-dicarboxylate transporter